MLPSQQHVFSHQPHPYGQEWQSQHHAHHGHSQIPTATGAVHQQQYNNRMATGPTGAMDHNAVSDGRGQQLPGHMAGNASGNGGQDGLGSEEQRRVLEQIAQMMRTESRESALLELSKKREQVPELALILWHSFGVMTSLLQEIISVYPMLNPSQLTAAASNRVCNALALLQCVASHSETRGLFLGGRSTKQCVDACLLGLQNKPTDTRSTYPTLSVSLSQHNLKIPTV